MSEEKQDELLRVVGRAFGGVREEGGAKGAGKVGLLVEGEAKREMGT